ncbi:hypothetical protein D3C77_672510 [compost metagenome]
MMVMGDEDIGQLPVRIGRQPSQYWRSIAGIDRYAAALRVILQQPDIVVGERGQCLDLQHGRVAKTVTKAHPSRTSASVNLAKLTSKAGPSKGAQR